MDNNFIIELTCLGGIVCTWIFIALLPEVTGSSMVWAGMTNGWWTTWIPVLEALLSSAVNSMDTGQTTWV